MFVVEFQLILISFASVENISNKSRSVKVLAFEFPPFTYFDSNRGFVDGIDVHLLKTIAKRLNLGLIWTKADELNRIPRDHFKYVENIM